MWRMIVIAGHYGSGKTELAVSLAMELAKAQSRAYPRLALVDLDVANPYFRSRERMELLEAHGVRVYGDAFHSTGSTAELPALTAALRAPLEDGQCQMGKPQVHGWVGKGVLKRCGRFPEETAR